MCLSRGRLIQLEEDKIVYKWVISDENGIHSIYVPNCQYYNKNNVNVATVLNETDYTIVNNHKVVIRKSIFHGDFYVENGVFHSYANYKDAIKNYPAPIYIWPFNEQKKYSLWKCVIPKNSNVVYDGVYGDKYYAYASSHLRFVEEIKL